MSTHNASVATSSKAEFHFSRNLGILGSLLENQPLTLKKLALEQSTTEVWITHTLLKTCKCDKTEVRPDNNWTLLSGFGCVCLVLCTYRLCEPWGMLQNCTLCDRNPSFLDSEWEMEECLIYSFFFYYFSATRHTPISLIIRLEFWFTFLWWEIFRYLKICIECKTLLNLFSDFKTWSFYSKVLLMLLNWIEVFPW